MKLPGYTNPELAKVGDQNSYRTGLHRTDTY
jgi:hypothetical protein